MAMVVKLALALTLLQSLCIAYPNSNITASKPLGSSIQYTECIEIIEFYIPTGTTVKHCTLRWNPFTNAVWAYWIIWDCYSWNDAKAQCAQAGGQLASFPDIEDKLYAERFIHSGVVASFHDSCGWVNAYPQYLHGAWIGLSRPNTATDIWHWENGKTEDSGDLPWNVYASYYEGSNEVTTGSQTCGMMAKTTYWNGAQTTNQGYVMADCASNANAARAICMKHVPRNVN